MTRIESQGYGNPSRVEKNVATLGFLIAVTGIALAALAYTAPMKGPLNALVQMEPNSKTILLGTSLFALILDLVWISNLKMKKQIPDLPMSPAQYQSGSSGNERSGSSHPIPSSTFRRTFDEPAQPAEPAIFFPSLNEKLNAKVFSYLEAADLGRCSQVSRQWKQSLTNDLLWDIKRLFPSLHVIDETRWRELEGFSLLKGITFDDLPPLNQREAVSCLCRFYSSEILKGFDRSSLSFVLVTIPKGLSLKKMAALPIEGAKIVGSERKEEKSDLDDTIMDASYRVIVCNNKLKTSNSKTLEQMKFSLYKKNIGEKGGEIINFLEMAVIFAFKYLIQEEEIHLSFEAATPTEHFLEGN